MLLPNIDIETALGTFAAHSRALSEDVPLEINYLFDSIYLLFAMQLIKRYQ